MRQRACAQGEHEGLEESLAAEQKKATPEETARQLQAQALQARAATKCAATASHLSVSCLPVSWQFYLIHEEACHACARVMLLKHDRCVVPICVHAAYCICSRMHALRPMHWKVAGGTATLEP